MPTKVAEAYVSIRANTATLMADMQAAKGMTTQGAMGMGASFPAGMGPGIGAARAQIQTIPATTAVAAAQVKGQTAAMGASFGVMAKGMLGAMGIMAGGVAFIAGGKAAANFEESLINATAAMPDAEENMRMLEAAARDWGIESGVGAAKAADAIGFLALAGYDAAKSVAALPLVLKFAGAGAFDAATGSDILTDAMSALGLSSDDTAVHMERMTMVADLMSKASVTANTSVQQLGEAMLMKAGPAAKSAGMEVQDLTAMLMIFADQGRKGSEAGTLAASTILGLSKSAAKFADSNLNKIVFDSAGEMNSLADIVAGLTAEFGDMSVEQRTAALMALGVNKQAADGVNLLMGQTKQLEKYNNALDESAGATDELATKKWKAMNQQMGVIMAQMKDFAISIIGPFVSGLISIIKPIANILVGIGRWSQAHNDILPKIGKVIVSVLALKALLPLLAIGIKMVAKALLGAMMSNPFTMVIMGLALVIQYMMDAAKSGAEWMKPITAGIQTVMGWLSIFWTKIKQVGQAVIEFVTPAFLYMRDVVIGIVMFFVDLWQGFTDMMDSNISGTRTGWQTAWEVIRNVFEGVVAVMTGIWNALSYVFMASINAFGDAWAYMMGTTVGEALSGAWAKIMEWLGGMLDMMSLLTTNWSLTWELVKTVFYLRFLQVLDFFKTVVDYIIVGAATLLGTFIGTFKAIWEYIRYTFQMIWAVIKATFVGLVAMAAEAWKKMTFRGSGKSLGSHYSEAFAQSMKDSDVQDPKGFKEQITEQVERFAGPAARGAAKRQKRRDDEITVQKDKAGRIVGQMMDQRDAERALEDEKKEREIDNAEEVAEEKKKKGEEVAEAEADALEEAMSGKKIEPEIGFKGIAEFGRAIQEAMLKTDEKEKARDDKQAKDTTGILDVGERQLVVQEKQLEVSQEQNQAGGLTAPA
jgi:TP901 family phage tail tape measure protein